MNQILMVEEKKKKNKKNRLSSGPIEIKNIVMFFAIVLIIFGVFFIGQGSYAIYRESKGKNKENMPIINLSRVNDTILVQVSSVNIITNFKYSWQNSEETVIPVDGTYVEETITLPNENSMIYFVIEDETGRAIKYQKQIIVEGIDMTKPMIDIIDQTKGSIKISATDDVKMAYITYQVNDEDEIRIDRSEAEDKTINYVLKLERGENKVVVTAVDTSGNIEILEKPIIVSEIPDIRLSQNANILTITIKDTDGVRDVEINLNGTVYAQKDINQKEITLNVPLKEGVNTIKIKVTNANGLVAEAAGEMNYAH